MQNKIGLNTSFSNNHSHNPWVSSQLQDSRVGAY